jgi:hypothetical protein
VYELWWHDSLNVTAVFRTEQEALASLGEALGEHGRDYVAGFILERLDESGERMTVAAGVALADLVEATVRGAGTHRVNSAGVREA